MSEWQPIETAPKDGTMVLLCSAKKHLLMGVGRYVPIKELGGESEHHYERWQDSNGFFWQYLKKPTHWMPLPTPPKVQA